MSGHSVLLGRVAETRDGGQIGGSSREVGEQGRALPSDHTQHTLLLGQTADSLAVNMSGGGGRHTQQGEQAQQCEPLSAIIL